MKIKFLTLNIFNSGFLERCIDFLKKENPDIFVLQEVYNSQIFSLDKKYRTLDLLREEFSNYFYYYSPAFFKRRKTYIVDSGNAIFTRFPILKQNTVFYYRKYEERLGNTIKHFFLTPRNLQHIVIKVNNSEMNIFNTQGVWGLDGKDNKNRIKMSQVIVEQIKGKKHIILAGDMNVQPDTKTVNNIEASLTNIFKDELTTTFNMKQKTQNGFATAVVDMIFVSLNIEVVEHYCPEVDVSDHLPLVTVINLPI